MATIERLGKTLNLNPRSGIGSAKKSRDDSDKSAAVRKICKICLLTRRRAQSQATAMPGLESSWVCGKAAKPRRVSPAAEGAPPSGHAVPGRCASCNSSPTDIQS